MRHIHNFNLTEYNSYKLKAVCASAFFPEHAEDIRNLYRERPRIPKILLGNGTNVIFSKEYYEEDFVIFSGCFDKLSLSGNIITAQAGAELKAVSEKALHNSLTGMEVFYDIPGSVGGAVVMNAGVSSENTQISDVLGKVRYYDIEADNFYQLKKNEMNLGARKSIFQEKGSFIVTEAQFHLKPGVKEAIKTKMEKIREKRWAKQPRKMPNAGSVFKRPPGFFVGQMIEELGLKGFSIGGAKVSEKHAGFVVNDGNAKGSDIIELIEHITTAVKNSYGVDLEIEQRII